MSVHLIPAAVAAEHDTTDACRCQPAVEQGRRGDGTYGRVVIHRDAGGEPVSQRPEE